MVLWNVVRIAANTGVNRCGETHIFLFYVDIINKQYYYMFINLINKEGNMKELDELRMFKSLDPLKLKALPKKKELRLITLQKIIECFECSREYSEQEVNLILMEIYDDYVYLRRELVDHGLLRRKNDGCKYWKES